MSRVALRGTQQWSWKGMILDYQGDKRPVVIDSAASYVILPRVDHGIFGRDIRRGVKERHTLMIHSFWIWLAVRRVLLNRNQTACFNGLFLFVAESQVPYLKSLFWWEYGSFHLKREEISSHGEAALVLWCVSVEGLMARWRKRERNGV